jgi:hypothetical protein
MVGFFKAFGKGVFEGFNDMVEAEDAHQKQIDLIKLQNSFKDEVIDPLSYEEVSYTDQNGIRQTQRLYPIGDRTNMSDTEFRDKRYEAFYNSQYATPETMDKLISNQPDFAGAIIRLQDKFAYDIHNNSREENKSTGRVTYNRGLAFPAAQGTFFENRFNTIARGFVPLDDYGLPMLKVEAVNGDFYMKHSYTSIKEGWGYDTKEELEKAAYGLKVRTADARSIEEILGAYSPEYWKVYAQAEPVFAKIQANGQYLDSDSADALYNIFNKTNDKGEYINPIIGGNASKQLELLRMAAPEIMLNVFGSKLEHITDPVKYLTKTLGIDPEQARAKATSANDAILTITQLMELLFEKDRVTLKTEGQVPLFGLPAIVKKFTQGVFGGDGLITQVESLLGKYDMKLENRDNTVARLQEKFGARATDRDAQLDGILEREVLYELLAYQVAAAIQGGTGGRTISDADVANIKRALGIGGLATGEIQAKRLGTLLGFMEKISILNSGFTKVGGGMKSVVAAGHLHEILMGGDINTYTSAQFEQAVKREMQGKDVEELAVDFRVYSNIEGNKFNFTAAGLSELNAYLETGEGSKMTEEGKAFYRKTYERDRENALKNNLININGEPI